MNFGISDSMSVKITNKTNGETYSNDKCLSDNLTYDKNKQEYNLNMDKDVAERLCKDKILYVLKTDKGYLKGDLYQGVTFVEKENARRFNYNEAHVYKESIFNDLSQFYNCKTFQFETVLL